MKKEYSALCEKTGTQKSIFKRNRTLVLVVVFLIITWAGNATNYYVSNSGDDSKAGTTPETAWKSLNKVNNTKFVPGDQILFERGGVWREELKVPSSGASGNPIVFGAYGNGANPVIDGADIISGMTSAGSNIWQKTGVTIQPYIMYLNGTGGRRQTSIADCDAIGKWYWDDPTDVLYVYSITDPSGNVELGQRGTIVNLNNKSYITLKNLTVQHSNDYSTGTASGSSAVRTLSGGNLTVIGCTIQKNSNHGILFSDASNLTFDSNIVTGNGMNHDIGKGIGIYVRATIGGISNVTFSNNTTSYNGTDNVRLSTRNAASRMKNISIHGNSFDHAVGAGLYIQMVDSVDIYNNTFNSNGNADDPEEDYAIGVQSCSNVNIYQNTIENTMGNASAIEVYADELAVNGPAHNVKIFRNSFSGSEHRTISITGYGNNSHQNLEIYSNVITGSVSLPIALLGDDSGTRDTVNIFNNTFYGNAGRVLYIYKDWPVVLKNNIFYSDVNILVTHLSTVEGFLTTSNNLYVRTNGGTLVYYRGTYTSETITDFEPSAQKTDPLFTDTANRDFTLQTGSPAINNGIGVGLTRDILGNSIVGAPDIGAVESQEKSDETITKYTTEDISICEGESYEGWTTSGKYERTLTAASGADSIVTTNLTVHAVYSVSEDIYLLEGENYNGWMESGEYKRTLTSISGCDSIVTTNLTVALNKYTTENIEICEGESYEGWTVSGEYERTLTASSGADSVVTTWLTVHPVKYTNEDITIYEGESYQGWTESGVYERNLISALGCDSTVVTNLSVLATAFTEEYISICEGSSYNSWITSGHYERTLQSVSGGDSIVVTHLTVNPVYSLTAEAAICEGETYLFGSQTLSEPGEYTEVFQTIHGCDSTAVLTLTVHSDYYVTEDITIYSGESYHGWTEEGTYQRNLLSVTGCDSIVTTNLTVLQTIHTTEAIEICEGESYEGWTISGEYERTLTSSSGADSVVTTWLIVHPVKYTSEDITILEGERYEGWTNAGEYQRVLTSAIGCDSIVTTHLTVNPIPEPNEELQTQTIELEKGWNVFSTYLNPVNASMDSVMKSLADGGDLVIVEDEVPNTFEKMSLKSTNDVWINNIGNVQKTEGYKIQVQSSCVLEITGTPVSLPVTIELKRGENLISFPIDGSVDAMQVIQPLIDANSIKKVQDEKGNSIEKWRNLGWVNGIGNFQAGEGYIIDAKYDATLTIHELAEKSGIFVTERPEPDFFKVCYEGNGVDHMNINMVELNATHFRTGDEIAAFDGEVCVGAVKLTESDIINDAVSIPVSATKPDGQHGFREGNPIEIRVWHINKSAVSQTQSMVVEGNLMYQKRASVFVQMTAQTTTGINDFESMKIDMYPNPARDNVTLRFSAMPEKGTRIELTDMAGRQLMMREVQSTQEVLNIRSQPAGMYLVKTISGDNFTVKKLIIN